MSVMHRATLAGEGRPMECTYVVHSTLFDDEDLEVAPWKLQGDSILNLKKKVTG